MKEQHFPLKLFVRKVGICTESGSNATIINVDKICVKMSNGETWVVCDYKQTSKQELLSVIDRALDIGMLFHKQKINELNEISEVEMENK